MESRCDRVLTRAFVMGNIDPLTFALRQLLSKCNLVDIQVADTAHLHLPLLDSDLGYNSNSFIESDGRQKENYIYKKKRKRKKKDAKIYCCIRLGFMDKTIQCDSK